MKTDDLVALLATGAEPVAPHATVRRLSVALAVGAAGAALLLLLAVGVRTDLRNALAMPMFWIKLLFAGTLALAAVFAVERLARPGMHVGALRIALWLPPLVIWALAAAVLLTAAPGERSALVMGSDWRWCPLGIGLLSLPVLAANLWALRGLAPTRPAAAGALAGLLAGAVGTLFYVLHCTQMQAPFVAVWYLVGIALPTAAGALLGPKLLRW